MSTLVVRVALAGMIVINVMSGELSPAHVLELLMRIADLGNA